MQGLIGMLLTLRLCGDGMAAAGPEPLIALIRTAAMMTVAGEKQPTQREPTTVVFVCQHGNVKSLIASRWFNRLAAERGLSVRAVSRGVEPETPVPAAIVRRLSGDGFDISDFQAMALARADVDGASRVVMIGVEPPAWVTGKDVAVEKWDGIPPASEQYDASRDAMRDRILTLLKSLTKPTADR